MENMMNTKITRKIGDSYVDFVLTDAEMESAFTEFQRQCDVIEVKARLEESGEYQKWEEIPMEMIDQFAKEFRENMKSIEETMGDGRIPAMESVFKAHAEELEQYKQKYKCFSVKVIQTKERYFSVRAEDEDKANDLIANFLDRNWREAEDYFENEDAEYESYWMEEDSYTDPDDAEVKGDD